MKFNLTYLDYYYYYRITQYFVNVDKYMYDVLFTHVCRQSRYITFKQ